MKGQNFGLLYILLLLGQVVLCNFANFGPYVLLTMLPAMVMCIPLSVSTSVCMMLAFASGLAVDWLSEGLVGINAAAIVPVALMRKPLIRFFLGEDLISRNDSFSFRKNGVGKISALMTAALIIFLPLYIYIDGAGTRPVWFILARICVSAICGFLLALIVTGTLTPDDRK